MPQKSILLLMCGLSFAGKTTIAREIAAAYGWAYISLDALNTARGVGLEGNAISPEEWDQTYTEAYRQIGEQLAAGRSVVYDETNMLRAQRDSLRQIAATYQVKTTVLYVATSAAEAELRWLGNRSNPQRPDVRDDNFRYVLDHFEPPSTDETVISYDPSLMLAQWIRKTFGEAGDIPSIQA